METTQKEVALKIENLNKTLGKKKILKNVSFETYRGEVFGFLGPNGAGKTTTIKIVVGMLSLDEGSVTIYGEDVSKNYEKAMSHMGGIVENPEMYKYLSGMNNLKQYARMRKGVTQERINEVVELVGLSNRINDKVGKYSLGMRQRLGVAQALLHKPEVLILDEPTNGLDPAGIKALRDVLKKIAHEEGVSVIVSSHLMSEMELMCDRVGIISNGEILAIKPIQEFLEEAMGDTVTYRITVNNANAAKEVLDAREDIQVEIDNETTIKVTFDKDTQIKINEISKELIMADVEVSGIVAEESKSLEDAFIELTKEGGGQIA